jgi:SAM-dependent methyltransferase
MIDHSEEIIGLYQRHAHAWAKRRWRGTEKPMEAAWLDRFMGLMPYQPTVLDIGCGSGDPLSRYLVGGGCAVTGVDSSAEMIALCESALPWEKWTVADMRQLSLGRTFDGLLAWNSFFHLSPEDQRHMFAIFGAHASSQSVLMFTSGPAYGVAMGTFESEPLYHSSLDPGEYRALLNEIGFTVVAHMVEDENCGRHTIWLAQRT